MADGNIGTGIGASMTRKEDKRFLTGSGRYTDDISLPGQLHVHFVRSVHAHANIKAIRTDAASKADGVVAIFTGEDVAADGIGGSIAAAIGTEDGRVVAHRPAALETRLAFLSVTNRVEPTLNYDVIRDGILPFLHQPVCRRVVCSGGSAPSPCCTQCL